MNLVKKEVTITRLKSMVDGSYRVEIDLGEIEGSVLSELENLRKEGVVSLILTSSKALEEVVNKKQ